MSLTVRHVSEADVLPLRRAVLRAGPLANRPTWPEQPGSIHLAAFDGEAIVGVATVFPQAWPGPDPAAEPAAWRLRGMAVDPDRHRSGVGRAVLDEAVRAAVEAGAPMLWANARTTALSFYRAVGWRAVGDEFATPETGIPHFVIVWTPEPGPAVGGGA